MWPHFRRHTWHFPKAKLNGSEKNHLETFWCHEDFELLLKCVSYLWREEEPGSWSVWQYSGHPLVRLLPENQKNRKPENNKPFIFSLMYFSDFLPSYIPGNQVLETAVFPVPQVHFRHSFTVQSPLRSLIILCNHPSFFLQLWICQGGDFLRRKEKNFFIEWLFKTRQFFSSFSKLPF